MNTLTTQLATFLFTREIGKKPRGLSLMTDDGNAQRLKVVIFSTKIDFLQIKTCYQLMHTKYTLL